MHLDPFHPDVYFSSLGYAYYLGGLHAEALENLRTGARRMPDWRPAHVWLATAAAGSGRDEEARRAAGEVLQLEPGFTIAKWLRLERMARQEDADRVVKRACRNSRLKTRMTDGRLRVMGTAPECSIIADEPASVAEPAHVAT